ncbi:MAG: DUF1292 domain-containing protein [Clostridia bacterium]|nr:DUF1292 domain-containing protein [Clostridia bacterium]
MEENKKHCDCCGEDEENCTCGCEDGCEDEIIELIDDEGKKTKFYLIDVIDFKEKRYVALQAAEEIEGVEDDCVFIYELDEENQTIVPVDDEKLLDEVYEEFCRQMEEDDCCCDDEDCECEDGECHCHDEH